MLNLRTLFPLIAVAACGLTALILFLGTTARTAHAVPRTGAATALFDAAGDDSTAVEPPSSLTNESTAAGDHFAFQASLDTTGTAPFALSPLEAVPSGSRPADTPGLLFEPGDVEIRLNGMSITGTGIGFINHSSLPSEQLEVRYSTDFVIAEEPFRVRTGEATFVDGSTEVASLDRDGLHVQIPSEEPPPLIADAQCEMSVPDDQSPASRAAEDFEDETVSIGGFPMTIEAASGSAEELSGTGRIDVPYLDAPLAVSFSTLSVNGSRTVYAGTVTATQDEQAGALESGLLDDYTASIKELAGTHASDISAAISSGNRMAAQLTGSAPVGLPFGITPSGGGSPPTLAVVGTQFAPTGSRVKTLLQVPMPGVNETLSLGAADVCLNADGLGGEFALRLPEDHTFTTAGGKVTHRYNAAARAQAGAAPTSGTYAMWRNDALGDLSAELDLEYSRQWLIPQNDQGQDAGGMAVASFSITTSAADGLGDFIAEGTLERSALVAAPGFVVADTTVYYDNSAASNPQDMSFPEGYEGLTGSIWTGLYVPGFSLGLPSTLHTLDRPDTRLRVSGAGMVIDNQGVSMTHDAQDVMAAEEGDLGGWGYGIDSLDVAIQGNSLVDGRMVGGARLPIFNEDVPYEATLTRASGRQELDFSFLLETDEGAYDTDLWKAGIRLKEGTNITVSDDGDDFIAEAVLHGDLDLVHGARNGAVKFAGQSLEMPRIPFEGFTLRSRGPEYVESGTWERTSTGAKLAGFPIRIDSIDVTEKTEDGDLKLGLAFSEVNLVMPGMGPKKKGTTAGDAMGKETTQLFTASTSFTLWSTVAPPAGSQVPEASFDEFQLDQVTLKGGIEKAFSIEGRLMFFHPETPGPLGQYGEGGAGNLKVTVIDKVQARAEVMIGEKEGTKYWLFNAGVSLPTGIALGSSGVGIYGFKGGAYYHMDPPDEWTENGMNYNPEPVEAQEGQKSPEFSSQDVNTNYTVDPNVEFGLRAGIVLGTMPTQNMLSGDINLDMSFTDSGGLNQIMLAGSAYGLHDGKLSNPTRRENTAQVTIDEFSLVGNPPEETFVGTFAATFEPGDEEAGLSVVEATGEAKLYINNKEDEHYFQIGDPAGDRVNLRYLGGLINAKAYLYLGSAAPPRVVPPESYCNIYREASGGENSPLCQAAHSPSPPSPEFGFLFGASLQAGFGGRFTIFYGSIQAAAGFDLALTKTGQAVCAGTGQTPGANGFYATGQLYAGLSGEVGVIVDLAFYQRRVPIVELAMAAELSGGLPSPTWIRGNVAGRFSVLGGLVEGGFDYQFSAGDVCELTGGQALAGVDAIQDVSPAAQEKDVSVFAQPSATFSMNLDEGQTIDSPSGEAQVRLSTDGITLYEGSSAIGPEISGTAERKEDGSLLVFSPSDPLKGETTYTFEVNAYAEEKSDAGGWIGAEDEDGNAVPHVTRTVTFTTGKRPDTIVPETVAYTAPLDRKRYFVRGSHTKNGLYFTQGNIDYSYLEEMTEAERENPDVRGVSFEVRYQAVNKNWSASPASARIRSEPGRIAWNQPSLDPSTIYAVQILRKRDLTWTALLEGLRSESSNREIAVGDSVANVRQRKIIGTSTSVPGEEVLYSYHFRTSRYRTYEDKLEDARARSGGYDGSGSYKVEVYNSREPFDHHDLLFGRNDAKPLIELSGARPESHSSYTTGSYVREYVRPYIRDFPRPQAYRALSDGIEYENRDLTIGPNVVVAAFSGNVTEYGAPLLRRSELLPGGYQYNPDWADFTIQWSLPGYAIEEHKDIKAYLRIVSLTNKSVALGLNQSMFESFDWYDFGDWLDRLNQITSAPTEDFLYNPSYERVYTEPYSYSKGGSAFLRIDARRTDGDDWLRFWF